MADLGATQSTAVKNHASEFTERVSVYRTRVDDELERWLSTRHVADDRLLSAMRHAVLNGGKRIRPLLVYASSELLGCDLDSADAIAVAIELIHAYSLVHDDLPAMDDDDLRRGKPTVHIAYDEATAILVGDALQALAFQVLASQQATAGGPSAGSALVAQLAQAAGPSGMVAGQMLDIRYAGVQVAREDLEDMSRRKTGRLISAAVTLPVLCVSRVPAATRRLLQRFADSAGLGFQIRDDLLDLTATTDQLGKPGQSDVRNDSASFALRFGLDAARERADELHRDALACLDELGPSSAGLRWLCDYIATRSN